MKSTITIIAILIGFYTSLSGQPAGTLDETFNGTGKVVYNREQTDVYWDVKVQSDGRIVAVGTSFDMTYASTIEVTRYMPDGTFDASFGTGGHFNYAPNVETGAHKCFVREDGKILVAGYTTDYTSWYMVIIQLDQNGTPDPSFGNNGIVLLDISAGEEVLYALAVQPDGKILAAGYAQNGDFRNVPVVLRLSDTGVLDESFGTMGVAGISVTETDNDFSAITIQPDGKIVAAGHISNGLSWFSLLIARFGQDGILDTGYGTNGVVNMNLNNVDDEFFDVQLTEDNEAILAGFTVTQPDYFYHMLLMKFDTAGQPVAGFGNGGVVIAGEVPYSFGDALALQTDGRIIIAGCTGDLPPSDNDWALWRYNEDGTPDAGFGTNGSVTTEFFGNPDEALGVALYEDRIIVAGKTRNADNWLDFAVARYVNDIGVSIPGTEVGEGLTISPNPVKRGGTVRIMYALNKQENVSIELVSILGNTVTLRPAEQQPQGIHSFQAVLPGSISAGVYFVRINGSASQYKSPRLILIP